MKRILVIGSGGSGKSTFSRRLGKMLDVPVIHLDRLYWRPGWAEPLETEWRDTLVREMAADAWIMDGNYGGTRQMRMERADTVIFLDMPRALCLYRVIKRSLRHRGETRSDMADGCPEKLDLAFLKWVWDFNKRSRPRILEELSGLTGKEVLILKNTQEVEDLVGGDDRGGRMPAILVLIATLGTVIFNVLAAKGYVNGITPEAISAKYPTVVTPAGYAFSIWSLIYVGLIGFSVIQLWPSYSRHFTRVRTVYILSCVLNCAWIFFWHRESVIVCLVIIAALAASLYWLLAHFERPARLLQSVFTTATFGVYAGWVTSAALVNFAVVLKYLEVGISGTAWSILGVAIILIAAMIAVGVRVTLQNFLFPLSVAWAAAAIGVKQSGNTPIVVAAAISLVICLIASASYVIGRETLGNGQR